MSYGYPPAQSHGYYQQPTHHHQDYYAQPAYPAMPPYQQQQHTYNQPSQDYATYQQMPTQNFNLNASNGYYGQQQGPSSYPQAMPPVPHQDMYMQQQQQMYQQPVQYQQPAMPQQPQQPSYQPQLIADLNNPNIFRPFFRSGLDALQMNSKAIIQDLTGLANQYSLRMASIIAEELEEHIKTCPPYMKLPAMYLMDSIAKNLGPPYPALFARYLERLFLLTYREVEPPARIKLEELLGTWRTGGANGGQLYPFNQGRLQIALEEALFGKDGRGGGIGANGGGLLESQHYLNGVQQKAGSASPQDTIMVANEIRRLLGQRRAQQYRDPHNESNRASIDALEKLEHVVSTSGISLEQISQIRTQLAVLGPSPDVLPAETSAAPVLSAEVLNSLSGLSAADYSALLTQGPIASGSNVDPGDPQSILNSLLSGNAIQASSADDLALDKEQAKKETEYRKKLFASYDEQNRAIGLTSSEITKPKAKSHTLIYEDLPLQCTQCAARWLDTPRHKKIQQRHMDKHFRTNNRLSSAIRAQSRSWFILAEEWVRPNDDTEDNTIDTAAADLAEIMKMRVKQPSDPAKQARPCPICKEGFKAEWSDKDEEWFWVDARKVDKSIYHASCYAEMSKLRGAAKVSLDDHDSSDMPTPSERRDSTPLEDVKPDVTNGVPPGYASPKSPTLNAIPMTFDPDLLKSVVELVRAGTPSADEKPLSPKMSKSGNASGLRNGKRAATEDAEDAEQDPVDLESEGRVKRVKQEEPET